MRKMLTSVILVLGVLFATFAQSADFKADRPDNYTVKKGDTLWDISNLFLKSPWLWPEIWHVNPQIKNPHLIYPGDVISLIYIDGKPYLTVNRAGVGPQIRYEPIDTAISTLPLDAINSFLSKSRVVDDAMLKAAPYVVAGQEKRLIMGKNDELYARGEFANDIPSYGFFRKDKKYVDPDTKEALGMMANYMGTGDMLALNQSIATLVVSDAAQEIRVGDRLLPSMQGVFNSTFFPSAPESSLEGRIIGVEDGVSQVGNLSVVIINKGSREGLVPGNVLKIIKRGTKVKDRVANEMIELPEVQSGTLMVFQVFDKLSLGLVLEADRGITTEDIVRNPND